MTASLLVTAVLPFALGTAQAAEESAYVEFLWSPTPRGALARQEARGFVLNGSQVHQVCVVALTPTSGVNDLRIDAIDASGRRVLSQSHEDFDGSKRCYAAELGDNGIAGEWTFNVYLDGTLSATKTIEVARTLEDASFYAPSSRPYVFGRPNYDATIPANEYIGRVVWIMHVNESGDVSHVEVELAEGAGETMKERAVAAGYLSVFPPDPSRATEPLQVRQEYSFGTD